MLCIELTFPAGRYHATPWGRHVNEGEVDWPPAPWRLLRALLAVWHRKVCRRRGAGDEGLLESLLAAMAENPPHYELPPAVRAHSRHYMPMVTGGKYRTTLVLDAFVRTAREPLRVGWPQLRPSEEQLALLDELLAGLGYLGRAESWVVARRIEASFEPNCRPLSDDRDLVQSHEEMIELLAALPPRDYAARYDRLLAELKRSLKGKKLAEAKSALPESYLEALQVESSALQQASWSLPPVARWVRYARPADALAVRTSIQGLPMSGTAHSALFLVMGKPLPKVEQTLRIAELARWATLRAADRDERGVPPLLSGHDVPHGGKPHQHAFFLPLDSDGDGFLDRLLVHVPGGIDAWMRSIIGRLRRLYDHEGNEWRLMLEGFDPLPETLPWIGEAPCWRSTTPYMHPWHRKKRFDIEAQIRRECRERGLPEPRNIQRLPTVRVGGRTRRPVHFDRFRRKRSLAQPDRQGSFWRLTFPEPVRGPLALGFGCHFGLGLFEPDAASPP